MKALQKFVGYIALKWTLFYIYQFIEGSIKCKFDNVNGEGLLLATFMLLAIPLIEIVVLFFPLNFALRQRGWIAMLLLIVVFCLEFVIGWYMTNQHFAAWMIVKIVLSVSLFLLLYRKRLGDIIR